MTESVSLRRWKEGRRCKRQQEQHGDLPWHCELTFCVFYFIQRSGTSPSGACGDYLQRGAGESLSRAHQGLRFRSDLLLQQQIRTALLYPSVMASFIHTEVGLLRVTVHASSIFVGGNWMLRPHGVYALLHSYDNSSAVANMTVTSIITLPSVFRSVCIPAY
jgi:hypothetical protein